MATENATATPHHVMVVDTGRCVGCWACAVGCKEINNEPLGFWWNRILTTAPNDFGGADNSDAQVAPGPSRDLGEDRDVLPRVVGGGSGGVAPVVGGQREHVAAAQAGP